MQTVTDGVPSGTMDVVGACPLGPAVCLTARPTQRLFYLVLKSHDGSAFVPIP